MSKIGSIYVEVRGDYSKWKEDMNVLRAEVRKSGTEISDALNNAISPKQAQKGIQDLVQNLHQLSAAAKVPSENFKITSAAIAAGLTDVAKKAGLTEQEFARLNERMLRTTAQENAKRSIEGIAKACNLSSKEMEELGKKMGLTSDQMKSLQGNLEKSPSTLDKIKSNWIALSAAVVGAYMAMNKAVEYMKLGAMAEQAEESFRIVSEAAGESADKIIADMKRVSAGTIDESDIMQKALKGMAMGLSGDQMVKIMEAARRSARLTGEDVKTAYETITDAISTQMPRALRKYGLVTKEEMALVEKALAAGITEVNLYEIAMLNAAVQAAKMGAIQDNAAEQLQRFNAEAHNVAETLGKWLLTGLQKVFGAMQWLASGTLMAGYAFSKFMSLFSKDWAKTAEEFWGASAELMDKAMANLEGVTAAGEKASKAEVDAAEKAKKAWSDKVKHQIDAKKLAEEEAKQIEELMKLRAKSEEEFMLAIQKRKDEHQKALSEEFQAEQKAIEEAKKLQAKSDEEFILANYKRLEEQMKIPQMLYEQEQKLALERIKLESDLYKDIRGYSVEHYGAQLKLIEKRESDLKKAGVNEVAIAKWVEQEKAKAWDDARIAGEDFWAGLAAARDKYYREEAKMGQMGSDIFKDYLAERNKAVSKFVDDFIDGQNAMVSAQKAAGDMMTNMAGDIAKKMWAAMIDKIVGMIGAHIGGGASLVAWQGANKGGVAGALAEIGLYMGTAVAAMLAGRGAAKAFKAEGGWIADHPMGGWIQSGRGFVDDVYLGNTGNTRHWGMRDEFIVNRHAASKFGPLLEKMNSYHADGGPVGTQADWTNVADGLVLGSGFSFLHGWSKGGLIPAILEAIAFNAMAIPSMFSSKYMADRFRSGGGWMDVGYGFFDNFRLPRLPFNIPTIPGLPGLLQPRSVLDPNEAKGLILDIVRGPYEQISRDILTPHKYWSNPIDVVGSLLGNLKKITGNLLIPKFHEGTSYVPESGLAYLEKGERVVAKGDNVPIQINLKLDGKVISSFIYDQTKAGRKMIHPRGMATA